MTAEPTPLDAALVRSAELSDLLLLCAQGVGDDTPALVAMASSAFRIASREADGINELLGRATAV